MKRSAAAWFCLAWIAQTYIKADLYKKMIGQKGQIDN
ncbi:MAG: hypothetical protein JWO91_3249 [Acidobacteriaceae bacterium]|nr:hypothetical protein [Acidobacteriaceae bacterium]